MAPIKRGSRPSLRKIARISRTLSVVYPPRNKRDRYCYRPCTGGPKSLQAGGPTARFCLSRVKPPRRFPAPSSRRKSSECPAPSNAFSVGSLRSAQSCDKKGQSKNESRGSISARKQFYARRPVFRWMRNFAARNSAGENRNGTAHRFRTGGRLFYRPPLLQTRFQVLGLRAAAR